MTCVLSGYTNRLGCDHKILRFLFRRHLESWAQLLRGKLNKNDASIYHCRNLKPTANAIKYIYRIYFGQCYDSRGRGHLKENDVGIIFIRSRDILENLITFILFIVKLKT